MAFGHFHEAFLGFCLSHTLPGGKTRSAKTSVFIRFNVHAVKAGIKLRGCGPLITPWLFDISKNRK